MIAYRAAQTKISTARDPYTYEDRHEYIVTEHQAMTIVYSVYRSRESDSICRITDCDIDLFLSTSLRQTEKGGEQCLLTGEDIVDKLSDMSSSLTSVRSEIITSKTDPNSFDQHRWD